MTKFLGILLTGFAIFLYLLSAVTFIDYMYSLTIRDTVTAVENAFGTLVILIFMLVMAKFSLAAGKKKLQVGTDTESSSKEHIRAKKSGLENGLDPGQAESREGTEK
jgi:hypothetical protein